MSEPVWLLSTRGRPNEAQEVLDACKRTGMRSRGLVYVDETVYEYRRLRLPANWEIHYEPEWGSIGASMRYCLDRYPEATHYGWLADDTVPRTKGWDKQLEYAAGEWCLAYADDLWFSTMGWSDYWTNQLRLGTQVSAGLCWGGELIRAVGWWAPPGLVQAGIDTAWTAIIAPLGLGRYVDDVVVEHKTYHLNKRAKDAGDEWTRDGVDYVQCDIDARDAWVDSPAFAATLNRIRDAINEAIAA
jgi:hypothetical protein